MLANEQLGRAVKRLAKRQLGANAPRRFDRSKDARAVVRAVMANISKGEREMLACWYPLQNLLVAAANISKMAWGSRGNKEHERTDLRNVLQLADTSPLRDPDLRNDFEHFDSRLDDWYKRPGRGIVMYRNIGLALSHPDPGQGFHHYAPETGVVTFGAHAVSISVLVEEGRKLLKTINASAEYGPPKVKIPKMPKSRDLSQMRCADCGNLTPKCTCQDAAGNPLRWS